MIDVACVLFSLISVFWVLVRAAMLDPLRPWAEALAPKAPRRPDWRSAPRP
jgi:hypothetical protein